MNISKNSQNRRRILTFLLSLTTSLFLTPLILLLTLTLILIREAVVSPILRIKYGRKVRLVQCMDSFQVHDRPNNLLETYVVIVLKGDGDLEKIRKRLKGRLLGNEEGLYEKLKWRVQRKLGFYCWEEDENFKFEEHVKLAVKARESDISISKGNNNLEEKESETFWTEQDLFEKLEEFYGKALSKEKPRWEFWLVKKFLYEGIDESSKEGSHYALIFRAHHSYLDGISSFLMLVQGLTDEPDKEPKMVVDPLKKRRIPCFKKLVAYLELFIYWPAMLKEGMSSPPEDNCFHGPELTKKKIVRWTKQFPIETFRQIRSLNLRENLSMFGTNAVLNAIVGGAFQSFGIRKGWKVPSQVTAVTSIPMLPYPNRKPQNRFSGAFFPLLVKGFGEEEEGSLEGVERLKTTDETLREILNSPLILMNSLLLRVIGLLPAKWSQNMTDARELTVLTSNVPGPLEKIRAFNGDVVVDTVGFLPIKNKTGFGFCFVSYCGLLRASIVADAALATEEDLDMLKEAFEKEVEKLQKLYVSQNS